MRKEKTTTTWMRKGSLTMVYNLFFFGFLNMVYDIWCYSVIIMYQSSPLPTLTLIAPAGGSDRLILCYIL